MASIKMTRIDYRLIHGQVVAKWIKYNPVNSIVVADDDLVKDDFMADIYRMAAPGNKVDIVSIKDLNDTLKKIDGDVMVIFKTVDSLYKAVENGFNVQEVNVGAVESSQGRKQIIQGVSLSKEELDKLDELDTKGINVYSQPIPENSRVSLEEIKNKI